MDKIEHIVPKEKPDPFQTCVLFPENPVLEHVGNAYNAQNPRDRFRSLDVFKDEHDRLFCCFAHPNGPMQAYSKRKPWVQAIVTMTLNGIIDVANVVVVDSEPGTVKAARTKRPAYYSHLIPFSDIHKVTSTDEIAADSVILALLFGDGEHDYQTGKNVVYAEGKYYAYDFGNASLTNLIWDDSAPRYLHAMRLSKESCDIALEKLARLHVDFSNPEGKAMWLAMFARLERAGEQISRDTSLSPEEMHQIFLDNTQTLSRLLHEHRLKL